MRTRWLMAAAALCLALASGARADEGEALPASEVEGTWWLLSTMGGQEMESRFVLERGSETGLAGRYVDSGGGETALGDVTYEGGVLKFVRAIGGGRRVRFEATVSDGRLDGHHTLGPRKIEAVGFRSKADYDAFMAARRKANERSEDLEADYDKHARRAVARDAFPVLFDPRLTAAAEAKGLREDEPVIGIAIGGEAKAYPVAIMGVHELANDTCGGQPIAASW